ncbi:L-ascorbate metabolism protein UlaG, beta-lactamase superfamily [Dyella jiangningensis]|uniref:MBL fold metallo-hydrolase n=1 Tax=Dyella sp. AtDHG13 TaxID=1938897 RepID=UPI0008857FB9|nr:MBL fold metallo-hydrolase [Dyella sp. AtDHG13]PXV56120.1 L-ascorbate metabolism protein UlaG (beta-lactamase superfamily) [Dyella sp. AtDHG13]SDK72489.1 L-ascorbate metabolism protein UlaG, beta-lactamase superfamily [Dyella jiangningensis]
MALFTRHAAGLRLERMQASPQYGGEGFINTYRSSAPRIEDERPSLVDFIFRGEGRTPSKPLPSLDPRPSWTRPVETGLRATWLGHSTVLLEIDGVRVLTDPVWGERASPFSFMGPKRFQPVPVDIAALPPLDAVLISHDHYDHLDYPSIRALAKLQVPFITSLGVGVHLEAWGVPPERIIELDWWESTTLPRGLTLTAAPSHHFSGRSLRDRNATLWSSFVLRGERHSVFFSGDTGLSPHFAEIGQRLGPFDLVMIEVGAFHPSWGSVHLGPDNAITAWRQLGSGSFLPVHWGTFNLAMHPWAEPAEVLLAKVPEGLVMPRLGEAIEPARVESVQPWWRDVSAGHWQGSALEAAEFLVLPAKD